MIVRKQDFSENDLPRLSGVTGPMDAVDHAILTAFIEEVLSSHLDAVIPGDQDAADTQACGSPKRRMNSLRARLRRFS